MNAHVFDKPLLAFVEQQLPRGRSNRLALTKAKRLAIVCEVMATLKPRFDSEALWLLNCLFALVEDRCTEAPFRCDAANHRARMYGPSRVQLRRTSIVGHGSWEFWAKQHTVWIGLNGAVRIALRHKSYLTIMDIPGADGATLPAAAPQPAPGTGARIRKEVDR